jgi:hypothetical protein
MTTSHEDWKAEWEVRQRHAKKMNVRVCTHGVEAVGLDAKDWIILRLLYQLYKSGNQATNPEARRVNGWFTDTHPGYGQEVMLAAFSRLAGESRIKGEQMYEPFWKEKGKWE